MFADKLFGRFIHRAGGPFRKSDVELFFQRSQPRHKLVPRQNRRRRYRQVRFRFVALNQLDVPSQAHQRIGHRRFVRGELIADGADRRRIHPVPLSHQILDRPRMSPGQDGIHALHAAVKTVISFVPDGHHARHAIGRFTDQFGQFRNFTIARNILGVADAGILPGLHHRFIHISPRDAQGPEEISFAAFVHAQPRQQQFRIQNCFITKPRLFQNARFQHKLDKILGPLALDHQLAALVKHDIDLLLLRGEPRVRRLAKFIAVFAQIALQSPRLRPGQRAGV